MEYSRQVVEKVKHLETRLNKLEKDVFALKGVTDNITQLSQKIDDALIQARKVLQAIKEKLNA